MTTNTQTITIVASPDKVFGAILDPTNTPKWIDSISHEVVDQDPVGLGSKYTNEMGVLVVTRFEQNALFELTSEDGSYRVRYDLEEDGDGTTVFTYFEEMTDGSDLKDPLPASGLEKLKTLVEENF